MLSKPLIMPRRDLTERMLDAVEAYSMSVIMAPTGYGKTTLAQALAGATKKKAFYYAIPAGPHDARYLWRDIFHQFEIQGLGAAAAMRRIGFPEIASQAREVIEEFRRSDSPVYLIIDDYHLVTDSGLTAFWENLVKAEIPGLHIALFSRSRPELNLEELRIKGLAAIFDQRSLAFSEAETKQYFRLYGVNDGAAADNAHKYSEGWPAAVWFCLQNWLAGGAITLLPDIESLLANTVFSSFGAAERALLQCLSVVEAFTVDEAEILSSDPRAPARLRVLREKSAFLFYDPKTGRYQFHGIFREFLRKELAAAMEIDQAALYRRAAECCLERSDVISAFRFLALAGREEDCRRLLDLFLRPDCDVVFVYYYEEIFTLARGIPWPVRLRNPLGYLVFIALCFLVGDDPRVVPMLDEARENFRDALEIPAFIKKRLDGELAVLDGLLAFNEVWDIMKHFLEAYHILKGPSVILSKTTAWSFGYPGISFIRLRERGHYRKSVEAIELDWQVMERMSDGAGKAIDKVLRAEYWLELGRFDQAGPLLKEVLSGWGEDRHMASTLAAGFCLARVSAALGRPDEAVGILEKLRPEVERLNDIGHFESFDLAVGYINGCLGREDGLPRWLRDGDLSEPPHCPARQARSFSLIVHGKALMLQGDYRRLALLADDLPGCATRMECLFTRIHSRIFKAVATSRAEGQEAGLVFLGEALELSRPDGIITSLAEYGRHILVFLRHLKRGRPKDDHLEKILALAERLARVAGRPGVKRDLLTSREREFMIHVIKGMSNPTIAKSLGVAEVTVKKTLALAYGKLGAANRAEASRRFVELYGDKRFIAG